MRTRLPLALLLSGALLLSACGGGDEATDTDTDAAASTADTASETATDAAPSENPSQAELVSEDLPDGVAATVGDSEIPVEALQQRLSVIREIPQVQQQLEGESSDQVEAQLQTQALGQLVLQEIVLQGAAGEDVDVSDQQVSDRQDELVQQAGSEDAFADQLASAGVPEEQLSQELRASIAFELVTEKLLADADVAPSESETSSEDASAAPSADPTQQVQQDWLFGLIESTDVVVDEAYGAWNPSTGQVVPVPA